MTSPVQPLQIFQVLRMLPAFGHTALCLEFLSPIFLDLQTPVHVFVPLIELHLICSYSNMMFPCLFCSFLTIS